MDFDSEELDDEYFEMNEEQKKAYKEKRERIKQAKIEDFKRRDNFQKQLKEVNLNTFKDRPDAITSIRCVHVEGNMFVVEWDTPSSNNSPIVCYNVYLSQKTVKINHISEGDDEDQTEVQKGDLKQVSTLEASSNQRFFDFFGLEQSTCYYVVITAVSGLGEGYKNSPLLVRTLAQDLNKQAGTLYVWGSNANSELGLTDDQVL